MKFPHYIYYEILIRLTEFVPNIGDFISVNEQEDEILINTTTGYLMVSRDVLEKQFKDPNLLRNEDIASLNKHFRIGR
ncbi:hypothetical protein [Pedobacter aquatilis]|uniref:hypothetical protein n=1 Tax=Pedobacter aquatilis TaxID=351343 RepID=UPI0029305D57|nr:hypothetical protein [Pedobacter aquatilis]